MNALEIISLLNILGIIFEIIGIIKIFNLNLDDYKLMVSGDEIPDDYLVSVYKSSRDGVACQTPGAVLEYHRLSEARNPKQSLKKLRFAIKLIIFGVLIQLGTALVSNPWLKPVFDSWLG